MSPRADAGTAVVLALSADTHTPHWLHHRDQDWSETSCYVDVWIELLHALGLDPVPALAFTLSQDFEGPHWALLKPPPEDLRRLYGIEVNEVNLWRPLPGVVADQLARGRLVTVEADAWFLPDTAGVSYRTQHTKTTIAPSTIDLARRRLGYFHGPGYYELEGDDFAGALSFAGTGSSALAPYLEIIRLERCADPGAAAVAGIAGELVRDHLRRRPATNPVARLAEAIVSSVDEMVSEGLAAFHQWAFDTSRQCGANAALAAALSHWMAEQGSGDAGAAAEVERTAAGPAVSSSATAAARTAAEAFRSVAEAAKSLQFGLARAARGRRIDVRDSLAVMETAWSEAIGALESHWA